MIDEQFAQEVLLAWNISLDRHTEKMPEHPESTYQSVSTVVCVCGVVVVVVVVVVVLNSLLYKYQFHYHL